jgi:hypothetical protein
MNARYHILGLVLGGCFTFQSNCMLPKGNEGKNSKHGGRHSFTFGKRSSKEKRDTDHRVVEQRKRAAELTELQRHLSTLAVMHEEIAALEAQMNEIRTDYLSKTEEANKNLRSYRDFKLHHDNQLYHVEEQLKEVGERVKYMHNTIDILERALPSTIR